MDFMIYESESEACARHPLRVDFLLYPFSLSEPDTVLWPRKHSYLALEVSSKSSLIVFGGGLSAPSRCSPAIH
jgi:hypothetical protein